MRHAQGGISRLAFTLFSVYALLIVAAVVWIKIGSTTPPTGAASTPTLAPYSNGPDGVSAAAIVAENEKPGTTAWRIAPGTSTTQIQGYTTAVQAQVGQILNLYVSTTAPHYVIEAYRMGWYQGTGARLVWRSAALAGIDQPACPLDTSINMVACWNWKLSAEIPVSTAFTPGDYLLKLVTTNGAASYIPVTIWDPASHATYVVLNRSIVEQGENTFGGYSFDAGQGGCIIDQNPTPPCNRARVVSFDRPYATGDGAADFLTNEFPLISLMEREGLDVTYITDVTLSTYPHVLDHHRALLSLGHDVAWTDEARVALTSAQSQGLNVVYFGGGVMRDHVRLEPSILGLNRQIVDYRNAAEDPLNGTAAPGQITSNTWSDPPANWPPMAQTGEDNGGQLHVAATAPMVILDATSWVFQGAGLTRGTSLPGVITSDFDHVVTSPSTPTTLEVLAHSPVAATQANVNGSTWNGVSYSDLVYFTNPTSHAGTFATGNSGWIGLLAGCASSSTPCASPVLTTITNNVLRVFGLGPAGLNDPATTNVASITPAGS